MSRTISVKTLKAKADVIWSLYIRLSEADATGYCRCCSCGRAYPWKEVDCGHFISRNHNLGRFKRENCHAQCKKCNRFREGNKAGYAVYLQKQYGPEIIEELNQLQYQVKRFEIDELQELIRDTKVKLAGLEHRGVV